MNLEDKIVDELESIFDGLAKPTLEVQKKKLGLEGELTEEDYLLLIKQVRDACAHLVGEPIAEDVYNKLMKLVGRVE